MLGVGHHGRGADPSAHRQFVARHKLIACNAHRRGSDAPADVARAAVTQQLMDAFKTGDQSAAPNHQCHTDSGQVFGALVAVGIALGGQVA